MSSKQRRRATRDTSKTSSLTPEMLAAKAREDLERGGFRDAIASYKQLLKQEARADWLNALAESYAGRARELAAKGMLKEALVMWENRSALDASIPIAAEQAALLMRMGRTQQVLDQLARGDALPAEVREPLRAVLAAHVLAGDLSLDGRLGEDDPLLRHGVPARAALTAYCAGDDAGLREALGQIPFRSPYRDWSLILKALQSLPGDPGEASRQLARIGPDSAFLALKEAAELALLCESDFMARIHSAGGTRLRFACALRGWPPERIALLEELKRLGQPPKPEALLRFIHGRRQELGQDWTRRQELRILFHHLPASMQWLKAAGVTPPEREEHALIDAWRAEKSEDPWDILDCWGRYALELKLVPEPKAPEARTALHLRIALALRRGDQFSRILTTEHAPTHGHSELHALALDQVDHSLTWDPDDRDTYLRLIRVHRHFGHTKDVRRLLDAASQRWPEDRQVLEATMEAALDSGAFKKAAGIARRILKTDPINSGVRERLVEAHLAHARKQVSKQRTDLARKELAAAEEWARGDQARERIELLSGFIALIDGDPGATQTLSRIAERLGGGLAAQVALVFAGESAGIAPTRAAGLISQSRKSKLDREELLAVLNRIRAQLDRHEHLAPQVETFLSKALAKVPWDKLSRAEMESACETLRRARLHSIRQTLARLGLKRWRKAPIFELHAFESKHAPHYYTAPSKDVIELELAMERARHEGDTRTALRIQSVLDDLSPFGAGPGFFGDPFDDDEDDEDDLFDEFAFDPDAVPTEALIEIFKTVGLDKALDMLGIPAPLKREIKQVARRMGEKAVIEDLTRFLAQGPDADDLDSPFPLPPRRRPKKKRKR